MKLKSLIFAAVAAVFMAGSAWAHHSHANYNTNDITQLEGTVKELRWMNPHTWIYLEVVQNGKPALWVLEGGSPSGRRGIALPGLGQHEPGKYHRHAN